MSLHSLNVDTERMAQYAYNIRYFSEQLKATDDRKYIDMILKYSNKLEDMFKMAALKGQIKRIEEKDD